VLDTGYAARLIEHKKKLEKEYVARIALPDSASYQAVKAIAENAESAWQDRVHTTRRMTPEELRALLATSSREIYCHYPFMTSYTY
jgi:hypothetical protein